MKTKEIIIWVSVIAVLIGGMWLMISTINNSSSPSNPVEIKIPEVTKDDFIRGSETASNSAKVTLVEYGDFQCPACGAYFPLVTKLSSDFPKDLRLVYRFFPLINIHKNAMISAQAAYAASKQDKFWEMYDKLYENQTSWSDIDPRDTFVSYAKDLKLDLDKFKKDMDSDSTKQFINDSENNAASAGINSTPTFFVNGVHIQNPAGYDEFKKIIQDEINKK